MRSPQVRFCERRGGAIPAPTRHSPVQSEFSQFKRSTANCSGLSGSSLRGAPMDSRWRRLGGHGDGASRRTRRTIAPQSLGGRSPRRQFARARKFAPVAEMASRKGIEPLTPGLGNLCSILLSYRDPQRSRSVQTPRRSVISSPRAAFVMTAREKAAKERFVFHGEAPLA